MAAAEALRRSQEGGFADWEVTARFYTVMSLVNGWLERHGLGVPTGHRVRRRMVEKHLPHLSRDYCRICTLSEAARYGKGYAMGDSERQKARAIHERISAAIPWP